MKEQILYVELKSGYSDNGPAWIGKGFYSKTGQTIYFNGQVFKKHQGISGNHFNLENYDEYWISGIKKNGADRHWAGSGIVHIDESIISDYLELIGQTVLKKNKFKIVHLDNVPAKLTTKEIENQKTEASFDDSIRFKNPADLTEKELVNLINYYQELDIPTIPKKGRKLFIDTLKNLQFEFDNRKKKSTPNRGQI